MLLPCEIGISCHIFTLYFAASYSLSSEDYAGVLWNIKYKQRYEDLCDELITRPEESYRLWRVVVCDQETSWTRRP
jgi:hypothetical protein